MDGAFRDLIAFERACGHEPSGGPPGIPDERTIEIRRTLHGEEFWELSGAMIDRDVAAITKEALDLIWVCLGTLTRFGVDVPKAWDELVRSNMSKFIGGAQRREDGKILKGPNYRPADMAGILAAQRPLAETYGSDRPKVVTLCGSTRFKEEYEQATRELTLYGHIVISVGLFGHREALDMDGDVKKKLDELHLRKIDRSDEIFVINPGGYIGESTRREIAYAEATGKTVRYLHTIGAGDET